MKPFFEENINIFSYAFLIIILCTSSTAFPNDWENNQLLMEQILRLQVKELNKNLPKKIDEQTTLNSVSNNGRTMIYNYQLSLSVNQINKNMFRDKMKNLLIKNVCMEKNMRLTLKNGTSYKYVYADKNNILIDKFLIALDSCIPRNQKTARHKTNFLKVKLPRGIEVEIPKTWWALNNELIQLVDTSVEAALDLSGMGLPEENEVNLIAANSMPRSTYASIRVVSITPPSMSQSNYNLLTKSDIHALKMEMHQMLKQMSPVSAIKLIDFIGFHLDEISGYPAFVTDYRRSGLKGPVITQINHILTPNQEIRINLAYRESESVLWKPVIGKMRKSIVISNWP
jgi:hypothetical protein